jgi:hypothetical protein
MVQEALNRFLAGPRHAAGNAERQDKSNQEKYDKHERAPTVTRICITRRSIIQLVLWGHLSILRLLLKRKREAERDAVMNFSFLR